MSGEETRGASTPAPEPTPTPVPPPVPAPVPTGGTTASNGRLARHSAVMAAGSLVSRVLGVVRASMIMAVFGRALAGDAWAVANTLPNTVYLLLAGGVLNAVLVPQITKAEKDPDGGKDFVDRLLTLAIVALLVVTIVCFAAAPLLVNLFSSDVWGNELFSLSVAFAYICMPAIFFYGIYTILGQVLNARERFGWFMWSPVLCNIVWIFGLGWFLVHYGAQQNTRAAAFTPGMIWLLAGSLVLGVAAQALVLLVPLYRSGFRFTPRFGWRGVGLGSAGRVAMWTFAALVVAQIGLIVQSRVLTSADHGDTGKLPYDQAFLLFMTPHGLITVSLVTALFTTMSKAASAKDLPALRGGVVQGLTLTGIATVPITIGTLVLGPYLTRIVFPANTLQTSDAIGYVMMAMMLGLPAFGYYYVMQRAFFAQEDAKTPFFLQLVNTGFAAAVAIGCMWVPSEFRAVGVALGQALSNVVAALVAVGWLGRRLDGLPIAGVVRTTVRVFVASLPAALVALGVVWVAELMSSGRLAALITLLVGGILFVLLYVAAARRMRVRELDSVLEPLSRRLRGGRGRARPSA